MNDAFSEVTSLGFWDMPLDLDARRSVSLTTSILAKMGSTHFPQMSLMEAATAVYALTAKKSSESEGMYDSTLRSESVWDILKSPFGGNRFTQWLNMFLMNMNDSSPSLTIDLMNGRTEIDPTRALRFSTCEIHAGLWIPSPSPASAAPGGSAAFSREFIFSCSLLDGT